MALDRTWYNTLTDDDGSNTVGTLWNKAAVDSLMDAVDAEVLLYPKLVTSLAPTTTGIQTALAIPTGTGDLVLYLNNASLLTIQGIAAGTADQLLTLVSIGAGQVDVAHLHASGTALGKVHCFATVGLTSLKSGTMKLRYDLTNTKWRVLDYEQGAGLTPTYAAGNFTANTGTWTVDAGDVTTWEFRLSGRFLTVSFYLQTTSTTGTPGQLKIAIPNGYTAAKSSLHPVVHDDAGAGNAGSFCLLSGAGATTIDIYKTYGSASFTNATNTTRVFGTITFEVN